MRSCVLSDPAGVTVQCFEWTGPQTRDEQTANCNEFEVETRGKKTLVDGQCPAAGSAGDCVNSPASRMVCYGSLESCRKMGAASNGTFTAR